METRESQKILDKPSELTRREWRALRSIVDDAIEMLLSHLGPEARHLMSLMADILRGPAKPVYRSPTIMGWVANELITLYSEPKGSYVKHMWR